MQRLTAAEAGDIVALVRDPRIYGSFYLGTDGAPGLAEEEDWLSWEPDSEADRLINFSVRLRADRSLIGALRLRGTRLSFLIAPACWRQGFASELVAGACSFRPGRYGLDMLEAEVRRDNEASRRVLENQGFRCVGPVRLQGADGPAPVPVVKYVCGFRRF